MITGDALMSQRQHFHTPKLQVRVKTSEVSLVCLTKSLTRCITYLQPDIKDGEKELCL